MIRVKAIGIGLAFLTLSVGVVSAQEVALPDFDALVGEGVTIENVSPVYDEDQGLVYVYLGHEWHALELDRLNQSLPPGPDFLPAGTWAGPLRSPTEDTILAYQTGGLGTAVQIARFASTDSRWDCKHNFWESSVWPLRLEWHYEQQEDGLLVCQPETGEQYFIQDFFLDPSSRHQIYSSPNGEYLLFNAGYYYSYHPTSERLLFIGSGGGFSGWLDDTRFATSYGDMPEWSTRYSTVGDAAVEGSMTEDVIYHVRYPVERRQDPAGLFSEHGVHGDGGDAGPCTSDIYTIPTEYWQIGSSQRYAQTTLCGKGIQLTDGSGDYLHWSSYPEGALIRFNPLTGHRQTIYTGEIEQIGVISADSTYAQVLVDFNGALNNSQDVYDINQYLNGQWMIIRLSDGRLMAEVEWNAAWINDTTLLTPHSYVHIDGEDVEVVSFDGVLFVDVANQQFVTRQQNTLSVYNSTMVNRDDFITMPSGYQASVDRIGVWDRYSEYWLETYSFFSERQWFRRFVIPASPPAYRSDSDRWRINLFKLEDPETILLSFDLRLGQSE